ncbi:hypothetical protein [Sulfitobacter sabulilitoris]|uniref:Uncharacterized protein n=1 Tax=Sulfitobacter sabulilitoris TaxID=2562655 RepID=A0A5S3PCC4_9RHOB|nr:hypothetical protein [Sulfitobacter sabulilitoris]TMM51237.1 hypothetical protein FDT80_15380 [Sulfitobacter sabulilitoris]
MADKSASTPPAKPGASRDDRLKAALKANLARRKAQSRNRAPKDGQPTGTAPDQGQDKEHD